MKRFITTTTLTVCVFILTVCQDSRAQDYCQTVIKANGTYSGSCSTCAYSNEDRQLFEVDAGQNLNISIASTQLSNLSLHITEDGKVIATITEDDENGVNIAMKQGHEYAVLPACPTVPKVKSLYLNRTQALAIDMEYSFTVTGFQEAKTALSLSNPTATSSPMAVKVADPFRGFTNQMTVEAWIYDRGGGHQYGSYMGMAATENSKTTNVWQLYPSGHSVIFAVNPTTDKSETPEGYVGVTASLPRKGEWHHYAGVISETEFVLYIDGDKNEHYSFNLENNTIQSSSAAQFFMGRDPRTSGATASFCSNAVFDEVRIWNVARTQKQIRDYMYCKINPNSTGLKNYFSFDLPAGASADFSKTAPTTVTADKGNNGEVAPGFTRSTLTVWGRGMVGQTNSCDYIPSWKIGPASEKHCEDPHISITAPYNLGLNVAPLGGTSLDIEETQWIGYYSGELQVIETYTGMRNSVIASSLFGDKKAHYQVVVRYKAEDKWQTFSPSCSFNYTPKGK